MASVMNFKAAYYRPTSYAEQPTAPRPGPTVTDDYERWYTEHAPNNRMLLSLRSGIHQEVGWALDRLCRLCENEQFMLRSIPGLTDALFEWPEWYVSEGYREANPVPFLFSPDPVISRKRRYAIESLFVLRNTSLNDPNAHELSENKRTIPLITKALENLDAGSDETSEFVLYAIELLQAVSSRLVLPKTPPLTIVQRLQQIASHSSNRSMIIASLVALSTIFSNPANVSHLTSDSSALQASIRFLPLFLDKMLLDACLNYLFVHFSYSPMAVTFLHHPEMPSVLRLFVNLLLQEQVEETVTHEVGGPVHTTPSLSLATRDHELSKEELDKLLEMSEPQRCYEWMKLVFVARADGEMTQVDFWNLYKDTFTPYQDRGSLLVASDVIKNVNVVFPQAQAMVLPGPVQRFVVRGVDRRKDVIATERFKCHWDRSQCPAQAFVSPGELYDHLLEHISHTDHPELPCLWASCCIHPVAKAALRVHVLTHLPSAQPPAKDPSQSDTITLASESSPYPIPDPTSRTPPPPRKTTITYQRPLIDPPSTSLMALLCIRLLFRASFASSDAAPRADADHFGFPGIVEETGEPDGAEDFGNKEAELQAERRGRKAFVGVRRLLEGVRIRDETLMGWITEMVDAGPQ